MDSYSGQTRITVLSSTQEGRTWALLSLLFLGLVVGAVGAGAYAVRAFHSAVGGPYRVERLVIHPHEQLGTVAGDLQHRDLLTNTLLFQLYFRIFGGSDRIQPGIHVVTSNMTMDQIAQAIQAPPPSRAPARPAATTAPCCTIPAGWRLEQIAGLLAAHRVGSYQAILHELRHGAFSYSFLHGRPRGATLEGFLYPGFYAAPPHANLHRLVGRMVADFGPHLTPAMRGQAAHEHLSTYQLVTLASIVQRMSLLPDVQRALARVYLDRLGSRGHPGFLRADPTVAYAGGSRYQDQGWWPPQVTGVLISQTAASPFNTYTHRGLPPGPISNVGAATLNAVLHPARTPYRSFVVLPEGKRARVVFCVSATSCGPSARGATTVGAGGH